MKSFNKWLESRIVENDGYYGQDIDNQSTGAKNVSFLHPLHPHHGLDSRFPQGTSRPNMHELEKYVADSVRNGADAVTSLKNLAAGALAAERTPGNKLSRDGSSMDDAESRGHRPYTWGNTLKLQRLGFRDSTSFYKWFHDGGGQQIVAGMVSKMVGNQ